MAEEKRPLKLQRAAALAKKKAKQLLTDESGAVKVPPKEVRQEVKKTTHPKKRIDEVAHAKRKREQKAEVKRSKRYLKEGRGARFEGGPNEPAPDYVKKQIKSLEDPKRPANVKKAKKMQGDRIKGIEKGKVTAPKGVGAGGHPPTKEGSVHRGKWKHYMTDSKTPKGRALRTAGPQNPIPGPKPGATKAAVKKGIAWVRANPGLATKAGLKKILQGAGLGEAALLAAATFAWKKGRQYKKERTGIATKSRALKRVEKSETERKTGINLEKDLDKQFGKGPSLTAKQVKQGGKQERAREQKNQKDFLGKKAHAELTRHKKNKSRN